MRIAHFCAATGARMLRKRFDQLAGIDVDRASGGAEAIGGAGIERHVGELARPARRTNR